MSCVPVFEDNAGTIQLAKKPVSNSNSKHIDVRHHFIREKVEKNEIAVVYVPTKLQHAGFLTKALPYNDFVFHRKYVMNLK